MRHLLQPPQSLLAKVRAHCLQVRPNASTVQFIRAYSHAAATAHVVFARTLCPNVAFAAAVETLH